MKIIGEMLLTSNISPDVMRFLVIKYSRGQDELAELADTLAKATQEAGHTPSVGWREIRERHLSTGHEWMPFIKGMLSTCDLLILVYDESLRGGFVELGMAYAQALPIWVLARPGQSISNSVQGCAEKILLYESLEEASHRLLQAFRQDQSVPS
ncbi:MAG TPA: hypothetical protein VKR06_01985 [Ktedonosporobacter sp.]|nr:hypothetical protein [Ktedonosporobacter sp.]